jgi:flagellar basal-body rod modification protein FlgD
MTISSTASTNAAEASQPNSGGASSGVENLANRDMFLKLLVAQMQNQNPLSPSDPMQFVSQLAEFSSLEQTIGMRSRLDDIYGALSQMAAASAVQESSPDASGK